ncbi:MAG: hypothetical protein ACT6FE_04850 [Methanosarcinaceae archaeon]
MSANVGLVQLKNVDVRVKPEGIYRTLFNIFQINGSWQKRFTAERTCFSLRFLRASAVFKIITEDNNKSHIGHNGCIDNAIFQRIQRKQDAVRYVESLW